MHLAHFIGIWAVKIRMRELPGAGLYFEQRCGEIIIFIDGVDKKRLRPENDWWELGCYDGATCRWVNLEFEKEYQHYWRGVAELTGNKLIKTIQLTSKKRIQTNAFEKIRWIASTITVEWSDFGHESHRICTRRTDT